LRGGLCAAMLLSAAAGAATAAQPAGGWEFAHWGMTRAEVRAASAGKAHQHDDTNDTVDGGASVGPFKLQVLLQYASPDDDAGLTMVILALDGPDRECPALRPYLAKTYAAPGEAWAHGMYSGFSWTDAKGGNQVELTRMSGINCEIRLTPLAGSAG